MPQPWSGCLLNMSHHVTPGGCYTRRLLHHVTPGGWVFLSLPIHTVAFDVICKVAFSFQELSLAGSRILIQQWRLLYTFAMALKIHLKQSLQDKGSSTKQRVYTSGNDIKVSWAGWLHVHPPNTITCIYVLIFTKLHLYGLRSKGAHLRTKIPLCFQGYLHFHRGGSHENMIQDPNDSLLFLNHCEPKKTSGYLEETLITVNGAYS